MQAQGWGTEADARLQALNGKRVAVGADFNPRCVRGRVCVCVCVMCLQDLGAGDGVWGVRFWMHDRVTPPHLIHTHDIQLHPTHLMY